jgi:predicted dehydrogenase
MAFPPPTNGHLPLVQDFSCRVLAGEDARFPGEEGMQASLVIEAAYQSARTGRRVEVAPALPS